MQVLNASETEENLLRTVILNVGVGGWHPRGSERLSKSIQAIHPELWENGSVEVMLWVNSYPSDSPTHQQSNYAFKPFAFQWAIDNGFDVAIWMDSAVYLKKPLQPILDIITKQGHLLFRNGWTSGEWLCDNQLEPLGITRDEANQIGHIMACVMGFDLKNVRSIQFLSEWKRLSAYFSGEWTNTGNCSSDNSVLGSRHDQSFASIISNRLKMNWTNPQGLINYNINEDSIMVTQGM